MDATTREVYARDEGLPDTAFLRRGKCPRDSTSRGAYSHIFLWSLGKQSTPSGICL
jgi:hypothetical protein